MLKKAVLTAIVVMLIAFGAGISYANQTGGMASGTGPGLPGFTPSVNPGGLGDALVYGYYNVRGNLNLFNIINTSYVDGVKVRVVFRNAKNSKECLDFTVCLSRGDVWTAYLLDDGTTARIYPFDADTLTAPLIPSTGQGFISGTYGPITVLPDDCREGYFEAYALNLIPGYHKASCTSGNDYDCPITEAYCRDQFADWSAGNTLMGNNTIFELSTLATYSLNATAIADFTSSIIPLVSGQEPNLGQMDGGCTVADYILMKSNILSPYDVITGLGGETEIVLTFPTRLACHSDTSTTDMFNSKKTSGTTRIEYCTNFLLTIWDDQERRQDVTAFSPSPTSCFPWEVNVLKIGPSSIWNSTVATTASTTFQLGWLDIDLYAGDTAHEITYSLTQRGLPTIAHTSQAFIGAAGSYMLPTMHKNWFNGLFQP